ncbi:peptidoglycan DD-metalloendopeptidase family protein [Thioalkalivibrio thiocyanodenitrificans]|uniref:peptidoglycan DD-metalloendopeptidase family protein n=1 Tax=Thioalkalivibrio thiocyanodenitrificans TaxID=243063 RepID=UPI000367A5C6|nr:peptidoglycan DD-metalloendopeptidase family protein [Thioalkalivibrio thiocyanodenitrificans]
MNYHSFFKRDYKSRLGRAPDRGSPHWPLRGLALAAGVVLLGVVLAKNQEHGANAPTQPVEIALPASEAPHDTEKQAAGTRVQMALALPVPVREIDAPAPAIDVEEALQAEAAEWDEVEVRRGDTLSSIFSRLEVHSQLNPILSLGDDVAMLRSIHPGERIRALKDDGRLKELVYEPNRTLRLHVTRGEEGYEAHVVEREMEIRVTQGMGKIRSSLFQAGLDAGMSDNLIMSMANIFGWDIDFALDLREGDHFTVIYQQLYQDGEYVRDGAILAAEFINRGSSFQALRYTTPEGDTDYYSPDGRSMRKAFLRTPVEFARISSRFGTRRHPILHTMRQHRGVDYAAPTGTPIRASGDGRIVHRGTRGGYGKTIIIQHGQQYRTLYAHMNGYARNTGVGNRVRQGQVIGYIGMTGMATGPHLHYEFLVNGVHRDPLTVKLPDADPLPEKYLADFKAKTAPLLSQMDMYRRLTLAQVEQ